MTDSAQKSITIEGKSFLKLEKKSKVFSEVGKENLNYKYSKSNLLSRPF